MSRGCGRRPRARRLKRGRDGDVPGGGEFVSFTASCGLPYHIRGISPIGMPCCCGAYQSFKRRFNVDVRVFRVIPEIDKAGKTLLVRNLQTGDERRGAYDIAVAGARGRCRFRPPSRIDSPTCTPAPASPDMDRILAALQTIRAMSRGGQRLCRAGDDGALHQRQLDVTCWSSPEIGDGAGGQKMCQHAPYRIREGGSICVCAPGLSAIGVWICPAKRPQRWLTAPAAACA